MSLVTKEIVRVEFDPEKIQKGDIISYKVHAPTYFKEKLVLRHGIVTKVERDWLHITGSNYYGFSEEIGISAEYAEQKEVKVVIEGLRK